MGGSKKQTVGYWYKMLLHFGICRAPIDALLEMRVADRTAWAGTLTESGTLSVSKPNLFGGEDAEGGVSGGLDVMMGEADQAPNAYLVQQLGAEQSAYRGKVTAVWKGGRWGAMNPYPKAAAFKVRRVSSEWYPAKAPIPMLAGGGDDDVMLWADANDPRRWQNTHQYRSANHLAWRDTVDAAFADAGWDIAGAAQLLGWSHDGVHLSRAFPDEEPGDAAILRLHFNRYMPATFRAAMGQDGPYQVCGNMLAEDVPVGGPRYWWSGLGLDGNPAWFPSGGALAVGLYRLIPNSAGGPATAAGEQFINNCVVGFSPSGGYFPVAVWVSDRVLQVRRSGRAGDFVAMNPAHILRDSITSLDMLGEPDGAVNDASFTAAADTLFAEGFGLCTTYDATAESVDEFQKRICAVIGATCTRDRRTGQWMLDLQRGGGNPALLPVLGDDDILDWASEPGTLDDAVNQVVVAWVDPARKEQRSTAPVQALGLIQALGGVVSETAQYPEIPAENLALRVAGRDLRNKATPLRRFELKTNRVPFGWRAGTYFRLQAPKRGIADMVCLVGEIDTGTLRQGAISITAVQDVFSMPSAVYVTPTAPSGDGGGELTASEHQRAIEAPYAELARAMTADELGALAADAGHIAVMASQAPQAWNYELFTAADGEDLESRGSADWTPACVATAAAGYLDTSVDIADATGLADLALPVAAAWDDEIVRVDAIDLVAGTITIGRGCADTVPATHAAGSVLHLLGASAGVDGREYVDGETVSAKALSRGSGGLLEADSAPTLTCEMASRAARPYPPAGLQINGEAYPSAATGAISVTWAHRDRVQQADVLLDTTDASVGPEPGTTYDCYAFDDDAGTLLTQAVGLIGTSWLVVVPGGRQLRLEVVAKRAGMESWQRQVRRFAHVDGLMLLESGDVLTMEQGQLAVQESSPPDTSGFAHRATFVLTGTHSANDRLVFGLMFSGLSTNVYASAAGTTTLNEFASAIALQFTAQGYFATVDGDSVHVHSAAAFLGVRVLSTWARSPLAYTVQLAAAPDAGGPQWTFIDLYSSIAFVAPCPSPSPALASGGLAQATIEVRKKLRSAAPITGGHEFAGGGDARRFYLAWYTNSVFSDYLHQIEGLVDEINGNADLAANGISAWLGSLSPPPMPDTPITRAAVVVMASGDYVVNVNGTTNGAPINPWPLTGSVHPSGYPFGIAQWADLGPAIPSGLPQISAFDARPSAGFGFGAGQKWWLDIDGTEYLYTLTGSETSGADVAAGLAALVDPGGDWVVTWEGDQALVTATASNAPFTCSVWASYGVRVTASIDF